MANNYLRSIERIYQDLKTEATITAKNLNATGKFVGVSELISD